MDTAPIRVLLVEDDPADAEFARRALSQAKQAKFDLCWAADLTDAFERLSGGQFDVVVLDLGLPACSGLESLELFRERNREIPIVVLTGLRDEHMALQALEQGAQDHLVKGHLTADGLIRSIRYAIQCQRLQATIQRQLEFQAGAPEFTPSAKDGAGRIVGIAQIAREISEFWHINQSLQDSESRTRAILETAVDAIITIDEHGLIESLNPATERLFGYRAAELIGRNVNVLMPAPYRDEHDGYMHRFLATGERKVFGVEREVVGQHQDGTTFPMRLAVSELKLGGRRMFTGIARDISDYKRALDSLAQQATDLRRANDDLEYVNQELKQFAYAASHDLKEPLRMVISYCQLLDLEYREQLDDEGRKYLHFASDGARRMQRLIDDLLAFSSVGITNEPLEPIELRAALDDALLNLEAAIQESGARIEVGPLPTVPGHRTSLTLLFQNLIGNAIKFHGKRLLIIRVACAASDAGWELTIADNGIGIEPQYHERIFGLFQRLHTRDEYPGTGIGLATCKRIVERHGGRIWATSQPGLGTTMYLALLRCEVPTPPILEANLV